MDLLRYQLVIAHVLQVYFGMVYENRGEARAAEHLKHRPRNRAVVCLHSEDCRPQTPCPLSSHSVPMPTHRRLQPAVGYIPAAQTDPVEDPGALVRRVFV